MKRMRAEAEIICNLMPADLLAFVAPLTFVYNCLQLNDFSCIYFIIPDSLTI